MLLLHDHAKMLPSAEPLLQAQMAKVEKSHDTNLYSTLSAMARLRTAAVCPEVNVSGLLSIARIVRCFLMASADQALYWRT